MAAPDTHAAPSGAATPRIFGEPTYPTSTRASVSIHAVRADQVQVTSTGCAILGTAAYMLHTAGDTNGERLLELRAIARRVVALADEALAGEVTP